MLATLRRYKATLFVACAVTLGVAIGLMLPPPEVAVAVQAKPQPPHKHHGRGWKPMPAAARQALQRKLYAAHGNILARLAKATAPSLDCRIAFGNVLPTDDQMSCGDCFGVSSADGASMALILAKILPLDTSKGRLSSQYGLDFPNCFSGGCNGGDEAQVFQYLKDTGAPLTSDYGPYTGAPARRKT